jgi:hypothetical protein
MEEGSTYKDLRDVLRDVRVYFKQYRGRDEVLEDGDQLEDSGRCGHVSTNALAWSITDTKTLPPDPENMNDNRKEFAEQAIQAFIAATRSDREDALCDLLCDLMHWADREPETDFDHQLDRARNHYAEETMGSDDTEEDPGNEDADEECSGGCGRPAEECASDAGADYFADKDDYLADGEPSWEVFEAKHFPKEVAEEEGAPADPVERMYTEAFEGETDNERAKQ